MKIYSNGEYMPVNETGMIARQGAVGFSGQWRLLGAIRFNNFGRTVERCEFSGRLLRLDWHYKNGKQKWHVVDCDHGTQRVWMNPNHKVIRD